MAKAPITTKKPNEVRTVEQKIPEETVSLEDIAEFELLVAGDQGIERDGVREAKLRKTYGIIKYLDARGRVLAKLRA